MLETILVFLGIIILMLVMAIISIMLYCGAFKNYECSWDDKIIPRLFFIIIILMYIMLSLVILVELGAIKLY